MPDQEIVSNCSVMWQIRETDLLLFLAFCDTNCYDENVVATKHGSPLNSVFITRTK